MASSTKRDILSACLFRVFGGNVDRLIRDRAVWWRRGHPDLYTLLASLRNQAHRNIYHGSSNEITYQKLLNSGREMGCDGP